MGFVGTRSPRVWSHKPIRSPHKFLQKENQTGLYETARLARQIFSTNQENIPYKLEITSLHATHRISGETSSFQLSSMKLLDA
jgi:hypothetical protein